MSRTLFALAFLFLLGACGQDGPTRHDGDGPAVPVTTRQLRPQTWNDSLQALGTVRARESITVTAKVSETVQQVHFDSGDVVAKGAALVTLSGQAQRAALAEALAQAKEADRLYRRQSELAQRQLIAHATLDTQRAARDAAQARAAQIRAQLDDRVIRAPFAGVLGLRRVSPGSLVTPGTAIATLDDVSRVHVDFPVPEAALALVAPGQRVTARSEAYADRTFEGVVRTVDARIDESTRAATVRADFANPDRALRPGMLLRVVLQRPSRQALLVPEIAVVQVGSESFVYRVGADGRVERVRVEIGTRRDGVAELAHGVAAGERIVIDGTGKLRPGTRVVEAGKQGATHGNGT